MWPHAKLVGSSKISWQIAQVTSSTESCSAGARKSLKNPKGNSMICYQFVTVSAFEQLCKMVFLFAERAFV